MNYIYYFTGTGNSLQIAYDLSKEIGNSKVCKITEYDGEMIDGDTIGIVFPVYNWGMPLIIGDFIKKLNCKKDTYIYAVTNFGGLPGKTLDQCRDVLKNKGLELSSGYLIKMPGNYIIGYGAKSKQEQEKLFRAEQDKIKYIGECVRNKQHSKIEIKHTFIDRVFTNYFYKDVVNFKTHDKDFSVADDCTGCGLCQKRCPVGNIEMKGKKPVWKHNCEFCFGCIQSCPKHAINYLDKTQGREQYLNPNINLQQLNNR
ncbi:EFR1 family ferrodoxin [Intestinibacter sp.]